MSHPLASLLLQQKSELPPLEPLRDKMLAKDPPRSNRFDTMGCLILAGGEGSRLGWSGPKGCMPLPLPGHQTLLELLLGEVRAKGAELPVAIMTSPLNSASIASYLHRRDHFGLKRVVLFEQEVLAVSDRRGLIVYQPRRVAVTAPAGNGGALNSFYTSKTWHTFLKWGVKVVQVIFVDNLLSAPFDEELLGLHEEKGVDLALRAVLRDDPKEKVGVIGLIRERLAVREYTEIRASLEGEIERFPLGNAGIFSCTMEWIKFVQGKVLPWHLAYKKGEGEVFAQKRWQRIDEVVKFETFLFDLFCYARSFVVALSDRKRSFCPLKTREDLNQIRSRIN